MTIRILTIAVTLCILFGLGCTSEKPDYDAGIAAYKRGHYQVALSDFETRAMRGDPVAQFCLGFMYKHGKGVTVSDEKAEKWAEKWYGEAAKQGYAPAQNNLGIIYSHRMGKALVKVIENGLGGGEDIKTVRHYSHAARHWLQKAALKQNSSRAQYNLALGRHAWASGVDSLAKELDSLNSLLKTLSTEDQEKIIEGWEELAKSEEDIVQEALEIFRNPSTKAVEAYEEAVSWYTKAAERGYALAQNALGEMYYNGKGVDENLTETERWKEAVKWYTKAADQGSAPAQFNLGGMYHNGQGVEENLTENERWKKAVDWYTKAADQKNAEAQNNLAAMYHRGEGVPKNPEMVARWLLRSAQQGQPLAQENLGRVFEKGLRDKNGEELIAKDNAEAYYWYSLASDDNPDAEIVEALERIGNQLDDERKNEVRERVQKWKPRIFWSAGTGLYIDKKNILTNTHVARYEYPRDSDEWYKYDELRVGYRYMEEKSGTAAVNPDVDLALLYDSNPLGNMDTFATFRSDPVEFGEDIVSFGYPISSILSYRGNVTSGIVSGLSGMLNEPLPDNYFQHTAPIQGGNSGGPIFDRAGRVVGVTRYGMTQTEEVQTVEGGYKVRIDPPQNVNFAIKFDVVEDFLRGNDITPTLSPEDLDSTINKEKIFEKARKFTVPVLCFLNKGEEPLPMVEISIKDIANLERKDK